MTDPVSSAAVGAVASDSQGVLTRLLGPTADVMGDQMARAYCRSPLFRVFERAEAKADTSHEGAIPPRVVQEVMDEAQWANNEVLAEYFSGVLAASRNIDGTDDSGVAWAALLGRLSSDQLAVHWLIYTGVQRRARTMGLENFWALRSDPVVVPIRFFLTALDWTESIEAQLKRLLAALYGLGRESLLEDLSHGAGEYLRDEVVYTRGREYDPKVAYVTLKLTHAGGSLLLQALGRTNTFVDELLDEDSSALIDATENMPFIANVTLRSDFPAVVSK